MPTYEYLCNHPDCVGEFEEFHSISIKLEECPHCQTAGRGSQPIERLISGGSGKGIMNQSFEEMKAAFPGEVAKLKRELVQSTNKLANVVGESKFHQNELSRNKG